MKQLLTLLLLPVAFTAISQTKIYKWEDELCSYQGTYDSKKITAAQLKNCQRLVLLNEFSITSSPMVFKPADITAGLHPEELEKEFAEKNSALQQLDLPKTAFWQGYKTAMLKEQQQRYAFHRMAYKAYLNGAELKQYPAKSEQTKFYTAALVAGGDSLLKAWEVLRKELAEKNGDPAKIQREYQERLASPGKMEYAFVDVMTFGWFNSANADVETADETYSPETVSKEWNKLFLKTKTVHCDEP